jgi:3-methyladenine DNA glycosylase AlkD
MEAYIQNLAKELRALKDPVRAEFAKKYMRHQFEFLGLDAKTLRNCIRNYIKENGYPEIEHLGEFALKLWDMPEREFQQTAIEIVNKLSKKLRSDDIHWIEQLIIKKSWWDTVDGLAAWICGTYFNLFPAQIKPVTEKWMKSGNMWLQRSALLFQLKYKANTDTQLLADYIERLADHKDFFIRKAIGWILREYSKTNKEWIREFVNNHALSGLSVREASKYI